MPRTKPPTAPEVAPATSSAAPTAPTVPALAPEAERPAEQLPPSPPEPRGPFTPIAVPLPSDVDPPREPPTPMLEGEEDDGRRVTIAKPRKQVSFWVGSLLTRVSPGQLVTDPHVIKSIRDNTDAFDFIEVHPEHVADVEASLERAIAELRREAERFGFDLVAKR